MSVLATGILIGILVLWLVFPRYVLVRWWRERILGVKYSLPVPDGYWEATAAYLLPRGAVFVGSNTGSGGYYFCHDVFVHIDDVLRSDIVEAVSLLDRGNYDRGSWKDVNGGVGRGRVRVFVRSGAECIDHMIKLIG